MLLSNLKIGSGKQQEQILVLQSKIIAFSYIDDIFAIKLIKFGFKLPKTLFVNLEMILLISTIEIFI